MKTGKPLFSMSQKWVALSVSLVGLATACSSVTEPEQHGSFSSSGVSSSAVVEAFIEHAGPAEKWAGPEPVMVQFSARDANHAYSLLSAPEWRVGGTGADPEIKADTARAPAAQGHHQDAPQAAMAGEASVRKAWKGEELRARLALFAEAVADPSATAQAGGCLYPVRVRLLRADGTVLEKAGCRASKGWPQLASRLLADAF